MKTRHLSSTYFAGFVLLSPAALGATQEEALATVTNLMLYGSIAFALVVIAAVYFMRSKDKRLAPLDKVYEAGGAIHAVTSEATILDCVRLMTSKRIGAVLVIDAGALKGIFTERDALNKVLAAGLDPASVRVAQVMTQEPCCVSPTTTVGDAMDLITKRRFRHLPIVQSGKLVAVVSSGDLTRWLVRDQAGDVQELVELSARS
jgi:CBS domain-containing protein